jgi:hypothetical protein
LTQTACHRDTGAGQTSGERCGNARNAGWEARQNDTEEPILTTEKSQSNNRIEAVLVQLGRTDAGIDTSRGSTRISASIAALMNAARATDASLFPSSTARQALRATMCLCPVATGQRFIRMSAA